jgi:predicted nucleic acid-binding protein
MADIVLDTNVFVALLDDHDSLAAAARALTQRLRDQEHRARLLDIVVAEAVSVLARRAAERKASPPDLLKIIEPRPCSSADARCL